MDLGIAGRTAVVAASTSGLGLASARALAHEGASVVICGRRRDLAEKEASQLPSAIGLAADLSEPDSPERIMEAACDTFGAVDILVWNSGGPDPMAASELSARDLEEGARFLVNPFARFLEMAVPPMRTRRWGRIVAIGSSGIRQPIPNLAVSNALRSAVAGICKTLAAEVAGDGVTVNMVLPGRIATARVAEIDEYVAEQEGVTADNVAARSQASIPAGRYGTPEELGAVVAFLCGEPAAYITGSQLAVDGGLIRGY